MKKAKTILLSSILSLTSLAGIIAFTGKGKNVNAQTALPDGQVLDEVVDTISVSNLTFSGLSGQSMIGKNANTDATFSFSEGNANKSLVFKFKYDVVDTTATDSNAMRIHFDVADDKWNSDNSLWLRGNGSYLAYYKTSSSKFDWKNTAALKAGLHDVEFGRIAILENSVSTNNYYVYYKLDGELISDTITAYDVSKMGGNMFINFSSGNTSNKMYDANLTYEEPQYVTPNDLKKSDALVGDVIPNKDVTYTYDTSSQPKYKSTVFAANLDYKVDTQNAQIYITSSGQNWNQAGYVWFQNEKTYFGITDDNGEKKGNEEIKYTALTAPSQHKIEYGRLAVMNGETFTGKYHVYFKLDGRVIYGIDQKIVDSVANAGAIHLTGNEGFDFVEPFTYEQNVKEISVLDLKQGGNLVGHKLGIDGQKNLTYDNDDHSENYSLKFKFKYEAVETKQNQFHLSNDANKWGAASSFILNNDNGAKVHVGKSTYDNPSAGGWYDSNYQMTAGNMYDVEFGRIAIMDGETFTGRYNVYLKIDDTLVKEVEQRINPVIAKGNVLFVTADGKNTIYDAKYSASYQEAIDNVNTHMSLAYSFEELDGVYDNVKCVLGTGVDKAIGNELVDAEYTYGIVVSTKTKSMEYNNETGSLIDDELYYKLIKLGDIINNKERAVDVFKVQAFIEVDNIRYFSSNAVEYSVSSLVAHYLSEYEAGGISLTQEQVDALNALNKALA